MVIDLEIQGLFIIFNFPFELLQNIYINKIELNI